MQYATVKTYLHAALRPELDRMIHRRLYIRVIPEEIAREDDPLDVAALGI